jgi:hypothetical protein
MPSVVVRIQIRRRPDNPPVWLDRKFAARIEAKALLVTVGKKGTTIESLRELISVPPGVFTRRRNSSCIRSMAFAVRSDRY